MLWYQYLHIPFHMYETVARWSHLHHGNPCSTDKITLLNDVHFLSMISGHMTMVWANGRRRYICNISHWLRPFLFDLSDLPVVGQYSSRLHHSLCSHLDVVFMSTHVGCGMVLMKQGVQSVHQALGGAMLRNGVHWIVASYDEILSPTKKTQHRDISKLIKHSWKHENDNQKL